MPGTQSLGNPWFTTGSYLLAFVHPRFEISVPGWKSGLRYLFTEGQVARQCIGRLFRFSLQLRSLHEGLFPSVLEGLGDQSLNSQSRAWLVSALECEENSYFELQDEGLAVGEINLTNSRYRQTDRPICCSIEFIQI